MLKPLDVFKAPLAGISLVEASAGTGKTYNITSLYVRTILEKDLMPSQILVLTFTEDATSELKNRLRTRIVESINAFEKGNPIGDVFLEELIKQNYTEPVSRLKNALNHFDEASVFTIHGFCNRLLNEYSLQFNINPDFKVLQDKSQLLQDCVDDFWRNLIRADQSESDRFLLNFLIEQNFGPDELLKIISEVINRPYAKLIPDDANLDKMKEKLPEFFTAFEKVKLVSEEDIEKLNEILSHERQYKKTSDSREALLGYLADLQTMDYPALSLVQLLEPLGQSLCDGKRGHTFDLPEICTAIQEFCDIGKHFEDLKPAFVVESVQEITRMFEQKKTTANQLSYDDFLIKVNDGLKNDTSGNMARNLAEKYPIALVDEFQDTDPIQYNIFRQIYHNREETALFMIGDPKQAIYGFRGADIYTYLKAKEDAQQEQSYSLNFNYRSNDKMIEAVNEIFSHSTSPFHLDLTFSKASFPDGKEKNYLKHKVHDVNKALQCIMLESDSTVSKGVAKEQVFAAVKNEIVELLSGQYTISGVKVEQKDIAILVRTAQEGEEIQKRLRETGIKSVLKSNSSVFKSEEAQDLFVLLQAIQKNYYEPGLRAALCTDLIGKTASEIVELQNDESKWAKIVQVFSETKRKWDKDGIVAAIEFLHDEFEMLRNLAANMDAERRITNLNHLTELLAKTEREQYLYSNNLLKWFYRKINDANLKKDEDNLRLESDENLIQISTIHASKGLEYPIVFCPFLWTDPVQPDKNNIYRFYKNEQVHVDIKTGFYRDGSKQAHLQEELRESARLLYVALTRSATTSYIFLPNFMSIKNSSIATVLGEGNFGQITKFFEQSEHIQLRNSIIPEFPYSKSESDQNTFQATNFTRKDLFNYPRLFSFSSLSQDHSENTSSEFAVRDFDVEIQTESETEEPNERAENRFTFPKGAVAGTFLHQIFEDLNFDDPDSIPALVKNNLELSGISKNWSNLASIWIKDTLSHTLQAPNLSLENVSPNDILKEMEFHFPVTAMHKAKLWELIRGQIPENQEFALDNQAGFMKGFIDLIFRFEGKYYILDYKSNHLGNNLDDYSEPELQKAILASNYDLQYHLYTLALHRLLKQRLPDYDYHTHFGGVFYLFLRGINANDPGSGVFFDQPAIEKIEAIDSFFNEKVKA